MRLLAILVCLGWAGVAPAFSPAINAVLGMRAAAVNECTGALVCQNFEGAGYDNYDNGESWTTTDSPNPDYTTTVLRGLWFAIAVGFAFAIATHGRPKSSTNSMWSTLLTVGLLSVLLWWGGFWGR